MKSKWSITLVCVTLSIPCLMLARGAASSTDGVFRPSHPSHPHHGRPVRPSNPSLPRNEQLIQDDVARIQEDLRTLRQDMDSSGWIYNGSALELKATNEPDGSGGVSFTLIGAPSTN